MKKSFGTLVYFISIVALVFMIFAKEEEIRKGIGNYETFIK